MNPFFDISPDQNLSIDALPLYCLGKQRIYATIGRKGSDFWGTSGTASTNHYIDVVAGDYDNQFVYKLQKWKPVYEIEQLIEHHYQYYITGHTQGHDVFLKHMRYEILSKLKKKNNTEDLCELFEQWLNRKAPKGNEPNRPQTVNNTINVGSVNAPAQFQQNSNHSIQSQHNHYQKEDIKQAFELIEKDIQNVNEQIRKDFAMEMDYAITQLQKDKDIKPQLLNIGALMKAVGMGTFTNLLAAPIFELIKPYLGLH
jgi:hypothetical protein